MVAGRSCRFFCFLLCRAAAASGCAFFAGPVESAPTPFGNGNPSSLHRFGTMPRRSYAPGEPVPPVGLAESGPQTMTREPNS